MVIHEGSEGRAGIPLRLVIACAIGCEHPGTHQFSPAVEHVLAALGQQGYISHHDVTSEPEPTVEWVGEPNERGLTQAVLTWQCGASWTCSRYKGHTFNKDTEGEHWLTQFHNYALRDTKPQVGVC